jgi:uncharacterized repeat protein (TIGR01451 family)
MKPFYKNTYHFRIQIQVWVVLFLLICGQAVLAQPATVSDPLAIGQNCGGGGNNFKSFSYDSLAKKLTQVGADCTPSLASPGFNPGGGSIAFSPKDQKVYYIETTTGNNSIVWNWTPGVCPTGSQAPVYTYASTFIVGLEFNTITGDGYQLEFSTGSAPYSIYLRKVTSFGPPLVAGAPQQIFLPSGKNIYQQNGDIVITPSGKMYFILDNKMFNLDYSTYGTGVLNANYIDTLMNGAGNNVIGLSYANGIFIASVLGGSCSYKQIDISSGAAVVQNVTLASGTFVSYDMATLITGIGAAKKVTSVSVTGVNQYQVVYDVKVKNYGNVDLNAVQLMDSVANVFGASFLSASVAAVGSLPSGLTLNPSFDGLNDARIFAAGSTMKATPADSAIVRVTANIDNPDVLTTYLNSAIVTATGAIFANNIRDSSHNQIGLDPDPSGTDVPDIAGEGVPTPLNITLWSLLSNKIVDFNAQRKANVVDLNWTLDNQVPGVTTALQRSADGISFETLATFNGKVLNRQQYNWQDSHPLSSNNYYRLQITSPGNNGKMYSGTVLIRKPETAVVLTASPNPFMQSLKFSLSLDKAGKINYRIVDFVSAVIQTGEYNGHEGSNEIELSNLNKIPAGMYILEVKVGDKRYFKKIVKNQ